MTSQNSNHRLRSTTVREHEPSSSRRNTIFFIRTAAATATQRTSLTPLHPRSAATATQRTSLEPPSFTQKQTENLFQQLHTQTQ